MHWPKAKDSDVWSDLGAHRNNISDTEGNAKTDELAEYGAMLGGRDMAQTRNSTGLRGIVVLSWLALSGGGMARL